MTPNAHNESFGRWFTVEQRATLVALVDDVIPADDFPGAIDAGVLDYLARLFRAELSEKLTEYRAGLTALAVEAQAQYGAAYGDLSSELRAQLLTRVAQGDFEQGRVRRDGGTPGSSNLQAFFGDLCGRVAEGYYSNPDLYGNRDAVSWRMIGFTPP